jgi:hypothetical protein
MQDRHRQPEFSAGFSDEPAPFLPSAVDRALPVLPNTPDLYSVETPVVRSTGKASLGLRMANPDPRATSAEDISRQVRDMEQMVVNLEEQQQNTIARRSSISKEPVVAPSSTTTTTGGENDASLVSQIDLLKGEVDRLRTQQQLMMSELRSEPPPVYEDEAGSSSSIAQ